MVRIYRRVVSTENGSLGSSNRASAATVIETSLDTNNSEHHYDISIARDEMASICIRNGDARYAVKYLNRNALDDDEFAQGRIDLAAEIMYLHALHHPNIVKMRGIFETTPPDSFHTDQFFLMDKLYGTLEDKLDHWKSIKRANSIRGVFRLVSKSKRMLLQKFKINLMVERLVVAYDIASAFRYMHSHDLVYR